jgi:hypothetical protein
VYSLDVINISQICLESEELGAFLPLEGSKLPESSKIKILFLEAGISVILNSFS